MTPQLLRALQAEILADDECTPFVHTNDMPKISSEEAVAKDRAVAAIRNAKRPAKPRPCLLSERGVRSSLPIVQGALLVKTLRDLEAATEPPGWLTAVLGALKVPAADQWAYFDALQCGHAWLRAEGLDVSVQRTRDMLDVLAAGVPELAEAATTLKALGRQPDDITADQVSRALRGPWGDE